MTKAICVGLLIALTGCASTSAKKQLEGATAAVETAHSAGADSDPQAHARLSQAESSLAEARQLLEGGNSKGAKNAAENAYQYAEEALELIRGKSPDLPAAASIPPLPQ